MKRAFFDFGQNWKRYSEKALDERKMVEALDSLKRLFGRDDFKGCRFLDIGCGSGIFSVCAKKMMAQEVLGLDINPASIEASKINAGRFLAHQDGARFMIQDILDEKAAGSAGTFDLVYAWGSLHHTGRMWRAIEIASERVSEGGSFALAIYNRHFSSYGWKLVKQLYNLSPGFIKSIMIAFFYPCIAVGKALITFKNPFHQQRGMDFYHDVVDWIGGYPYEYASVREVEEFLKARGFRLERCFPAKIPLANNEFVFVKTRPAAEPPKPRRILAFCYEYREVGGGAANALYHLSREWARLGCEVTVVTSGFGKLAADEFSEGVRIIRIPVGRRHLYRSTQFEMLRYMLGSVGISEKLARDLKPDRVLAFTALPGGLAPLWLNIRKRLPFVTFMRGADTPGFDPEALGWQYWMLGPLLRCIWERSAAVVSVNSDFAARVRAGTSKVPPVHTIPNGVDTEFFSPPPGGRIHDGPVRIFFAGRFVDRQKNLTMIIRAVSQVPEVVLEIAGDGPDAGRIKDLAHKLGAEDRIRFLGWLDKNGLREAYGRAHVYVSASRKEGMPNTVLEAMASGLPLILSDIVGHRELVESGKNGFLFGVDDEQALCGYLRRLLSDRPLRDEFAAESRRRACSLFHWKEVARKQLMILTGLWI